MTRLKGLPHTYDKSVSKSQRTLLILLIKQTITLKLQLYDGTMALRCPLLAPRPGRWVQCWICTSSGVNWIVEVHAFLLWGTLNSLNRNFVTIKKIFFLGRPSQNFCLLSTLIICLLTYDLQNSALLFHHFLEILWSLFEECCNAICQGHWSLGSFQSILPSGRQWSHILEIPWQPERPAQWG